MHTAGRKAELTALTVATAKVGRHGVGAGLYSPFPLAARGNGCIALPRRQGHGNRTLARRILFRSPRRGVADQRRSSSSEFIAITLANGAQRPPRLRQDMPHSLWRFSPRHSVCFETMTVAHENTAQWGLTCRDCGGLLAPGWINEFLQLFTRACRARVFIRQNGRTIGRRSPILKKPATEAEPLLSVFRC